MHCPAPGGGGIGCVCTSSLPVFAIGLTGDLRMNIAVEARFAEIDEVACGGKSEETCRGVRIGTVIAIEGFGDEGAEGFGAVTIDDHRHGEAGSFQSLDATTKGAGHQILPLSTRDWTAAKYSSP